MSTKSQPKFNCIFSVEDSKVINGFQYDINTNALDVRMTSGTWYRYRSISPSVFTKLITAKSMGRAYNKLIRGTYTSTKLHQKKVDPKQSIH